MDGRSKLIRRFRITLPAALLAGVGILSLGVPLDGPGPVRQSAAAQQPPATIIEPPIIGGPAMVRRLTESQYRASIADIFGPTIPVLGRFERGLREDGLLAIGTSHAGISAFSLEQYHVSAQGIAAAVLSEKIETGLSRAVPLRKPPSTLPAPAASSRNMASPCFAVRSARKRQGDF